MKGYRDRIRRRIVRRLLPEDEFDCLLMCIDVTLDAARRVGVEVGDVLQDDALTLAAYFEIDESTFEPSLFGDLAASLTLIDGGAE